MNAPQLTISDIQAAIAKAEYLVIPRTTTTICHLTMQNGFTVVGKSACASPENFNIALGEKYAYEDAVNKVWELEGYLLKERLYQSKLNGASA